MKTTKYYIKRNKVELNNDNNTTSVKAKTGASGKRKFKKKKIAQYHLFARQICILTLGKKKKYRTFVLVCYIKRGTQNNQFQTIISKDAYVFFFLATCKL